MPLPISVLVIDDEEVLRDSCRQILERRGYSVEEAGSGAEGLKALHRRSFDLVILDLRMPGMPGLDVLRRIKEAAPETLVLIITGHPSVSSAVEAMKLGAYDFLPKPFTPEEMLSILGRALEKRRLSMENAVLREELTTVLKEAPMVGSGAGMREVRALIDKVAPTEATVLLSGESGTGKELAARAIHRASARRGGAFIPVDCGSIVPTLFESELFGHVRGAFTDAVETRKGKLELADGGTVFLDEVGNIGQDVQVKLLRAIQEREIRKVGDSRPVKIDARIVAATNRDLRKAVERGEFRDDLYYRLNVVSIHLPPLRERQDDIPELARHLLAKHGRRSGKGAVSISEEAMRLLLAYPWPGNIRELENVIERALILAEGPVIRPQSLPMLEPAAPGREPRGTADSVVTLAELEREHILRALSRFEGNKSRTAEALGIDRKTLHLKLKAYGVENHA
ncbi:MAG TPA: sigma-54-dependent Fis family transcriptional regulator [Elusimicrobia bacterium]|nr:sigma-54-dependent Fis family transcriptional regulator [Elusimicrobiota bacterium]